MAITPLIGPLGRYPDYARGENQYARIVGTQTVVLVAHGGGMIHSVTTGAPGTTAKFFDTPTGGTTDDTTEIATVDLTSSSPGATVLLDVDFSQGLTCVVVGATTDITISFRGTLTKNPIFFGTQLDGNAGRASGTSTDKAMPS